ncbi:MAG: hypothetical protein OXQ28_12395 [Acidobacteriota bacterium]|nr:hypothetical protein [Acidobacteriota bacterium]
MRLDTAVELLGAMPFFDLATVVQLTEEPHANIVNQLHRWSRAGKLVPLRRGMYTFAERYRRVPVPPAVLANALYSPSYVSGLWALAFYGLIPEGVSAYTSVTTRAPQRFDNPYGTFLYTAIKRSFFFGYRTVSIAGAAVVLATPEKALLDLFHLGRGEWDRPRMIEMRFQQSDGVDQNRLLACAQRMGKPRILRAVQVWRECCDGSQDEGVDL